MLRPVIGNAEKLNCRNEDFELTLHGLWCHYIMTRSNNDHLDAIRSRAFHFLIKATWFSLRWRTVTVSKERFVFMRSAPARFALIMAVAALFAARPASADITLALVGPLSGAQAEIGDQMRHGAEAAVAQLNAQGGILGQKIILRNEDDVCDPKQAVSIANRLASAGVKFVVGHYCSATSIAASDVYADNDIIEVAPGSTNPLYTERGLKNVFRVCGRDDQQAAVAADYVAQHFRGQVVAISHDASSPGVTLSTVFEQRLKEDGIVPVLNEGIQKGDVDFGALITRLASEHVEVLYHVAYHKEAALILRQANDRGLKLRLISGDDMNVSDFWSITGAAGTGALFTFQADPRRTPEAQTAVAQLRAAKFEPAGYTLYSYAAVQIIAQAIEQAKSTKFAEVAGLMHGRAFDTVIGKLSFDVKGDLQGPSYRVYEWRDGTYDYAPE